ncbi:MAG: hypothetical protein KF906_05930 [Actinobacteria bacterium]|nr:hypothetical protein [Actinomycetota bacterium]
MPAPPTPPDARPPATRTLGPPRGLPSSRAALGGLLVAVAAMGTWVAATGDRGTEAQTYVVAVRPVAPGVELSADDLALAEADLPHRLRSKVFGDPSDLVGAVTRGPLGPGELVQSSSVVVDQRSSAALELSFSIDPAWAVAGTLGTGDRIDVYATDDDGTERVLVDVTVLHVDDGDDGGLGGGIGTQTLTVAGDDPATVADAVSAIRSADVTVVRRNRPVDDAPGDDEDGGDR